MNLDDAEIQNLEITKFIFHVVHLQQDEPILLDETPITGFEKFFLARVKETLRGNGFVFSDGSVTRAALKQIDDDENQFVPVSKVLAQTFHAGKDRRIKPGVMMLMQLATGRRRLYSLLKYDHEESLTYDITSDAKAILKSIANSFTKSPDALQKCALIELTKAGGNIVVIDRTVRQDITDFFRGFLVCKRRYSTTEMTSVAKDVIVEVVKRHQDVLPLEITKAAQERYYEAVQKRDTFDPDQFFAEYFGASGSEEVRASYDKGLDRHSMKGEVFTFDKTAVTTFKPEKFKTAEGVKIEIPKQASDTVSREEGPDGFTVITIKTRKLMLQ
ncbi:nucleoid-associated protein [Rhizobium ruizarguesonis]|uniref:nucleoid-associated protein n=1 Tax=Rhizobium TaxID=379 RepID=UPI001031CAD5|nr:nucleoid-associated protein [Rhizobium ruizarguesonis]TBA44391.1 hypothetical protein ELH62_19345 [Rhizobium ruizarguesonis]TBD65476.1 hypothetical protein ELH22_20180 [Rhizobium ruizarguesonis]